MHAILALVPIVLIVALMVGLGRSAAVAGISGLIATLAIAVAAFEFAVAPAPALAGSALEGLFLSATILWILLPALAIHELQTSRRSVDVLRDALTSVTANPLLIGILIGWFFALFLEGASGFGAPIALAAPLLVAMGFEPGRAVAVALIGHAAGVSFGAVGTPVLAQAALTGFAAPEIARPTGWMHAALGLILMAFLVRAAGDGTKPLGVVGWGWAMAAAAFFLLPFAAISSAVGPELPTLGGAVLGGFGFVALVRLASRDGPTGATAADVGRAPISSRRHFPTCS